MSAQDLIARTNEFLTAYQNKDLAAISEMVSEDVLLRDWNLEVSGKDALLYEFDKNFRSSNTIKIEVKNHYLSDLAVMAELQIVVDEQIVLAVVDRLSFESSGLVTEIVSYKAL